MQHHRCRVNVGAKALHAHYQAELSHYTVAPQWLAPLQAQLHAALHQLDTDAAGLRVGVKQQLRAVAAKLETLEERFVLGEIDRSLYKKYSEKIRTQEEAPLQAEQQRLGAQLSNPAALVAQAVEIAAQLPALWEMVPGVPNKVCNNCSTPAGWHLTSKWACIEPDE